MTSARRVRHGHFRRWGAVYLLLALFIASWAGQFLATIEELRGEAAQHGETFAWADFWPVFLGATFENWQSEWLQLILQAVVLLGLKHVLFTADAEDMEVVQRDLAEIKRALGLPLEEGDFDLSEPRAGSDGPSRVATGSSP